MAEEMKNEDVKEEVKEEETVEETVEQADKEETKEKKKTEKSEKAVKKKAKKDKKSEKIEELNDRLMRNLAEFENFRNRSEKEKSAMFEIGAKSVVEKMLPVWITWSEVLTDFPMKKKRHHLPKELRPFTNSFLPD